jgi:SAM-dependent methyltransferase
MRARLAIGGIPSILPFLRKWALADDVLRRELEYHEKLYSGFAQRHFARPAVRALRAHMVDRILQLTGAGPESRVLSLGCGIGDTELLLASRVKQLVGLDLSPSAVRQATGDAARAGVRNATFIEGSLERAEGCYDAVIAIFFLHHLPDDGLAGLPAKMRELLAAGGAFYSLDPSARRLSGKVGRLLIPGMMKKYQTEDERELEPGATRDLFDRGGFEARVSMYDFASSPWAGLFPGWGAGYRAVRALDDVLLRLPGLARLGSNFEVVARCR